MRFVYVKKNERKSGILNSIRYWICSYITGFYVDKNNKEVYYLTDKSVARKKLIDKLEKENVDYVLCEDGLHLNYKKMDGSEILKYFVFETIEYIFNKMNNSINEIFVSVNTCDKNNMNMIKKLAKQYKVVNIITENKKWYEYEENLEESNLYITVNNNKRTSLKKAKLLLNLDFKTLKGYNCNRKMIIIDMFGKIIVPKAFDGIIIKKVLIDTGKVMRIFSEFPNFKKYQLIECNMLEADDKEGFKNTNKLYIHKIVGNQIIEDEEILKINH